MSEQERPNQSMPGTATNQSDPQCCIDRNEIPSSIPAAIVKPRRMSFAWIIPLIAIVSVSYLVWVQVSADVGIRITIVFDESVGLEPGSKLVHRGVNVGVVREVNLSIDQDGVDVIAELKPGFESFAVKGTQFWVVRPIVSLQQVEGLETLLGPRYISLRPGSSDASGTAPVQYTFEGLEFAPVADLPSDGSLRIVLRSDRLGTLSAGNPVLYREIRVGTVRNAHLTDDATSVLVYIDIEPRFAPLVHEKTRFWRSGGVGVDFGLFSGLSVQADSIEAAMSSSISLATPSKKPGDLASPGDEFELSDKVDEDWLKWSPTIDISSP